MGTTRTFEGWGDPFFFSEAARGGPLTWRAGADRFEGDELGPVRHAHDRAAEYFFALSGAIVVEVGGEERVLEEGELCYVPPDAPHNVLGIASACDARILCVVAPNLADAKWRIDDFEPGGEQLRQSVARPFAGQQPPAGGTVAAEAFTLRAGEPPVELLPRGYESVYLVVEGALDVALANGMHGTLRTGAFLHVRDGVRHELATSAACSVLRIDCAHDNWATVAKPEGA